MVLMGCGPLQRARNLAVGWSSHRTETAIRLLDVLERSRELGFLGPGPVESHIAHALAFVEVAARFAPHRILDLGSGGGIPGLVVAHELGAAAFVLVDANERRTSFLEKSVAMLGLTERVQVVRARAEALAHDGAYRGIFDVVMARSFAAPAVTAECGAPFLRVGGGLVVAEPPDSDGARWEVDALAEVGLATEGLAHDEPKLMLLMARSACPERYPRRNPGKRPLF